MTPLQSLLLGAIEGVTEFLPVSSTGHLILASTLLGIPHTDFQKTFEIAIQLGAIFAVVALYWRSLLDLSLLTKLFVAFVPTGVIGLALYGFIKSYLIGNETVVVAALGIGGALLIAFELLHKEKPGAVAEVSQMTYLQCAAIGLFQALAIVPGVSRAAATIVGGLVMGLRRGAIVEFSFLLAVPTMAAATGFDLLQSADSFSKDQAGLLLAGFLSAFLVALLAMKFLLRFVRSHTFIPFGVYRIAIAALFFMLVLA